MSLLNPQLAAFAAVIDEGSFEAAARRLSLTASAVSQRIKALEDRFGQVLVVRRLPCRPTEAGERLLQSAQQMRLLEAETLASFAVSHPARTSSAPARMPIAVNADSLASWLLPALAAMHDSEGTLFDVRIEDQDHSTRLLRDGSVMGAITAESRAVQGCAVQTLGRMRYIAMAAPGFIARHFARAVDADALATAPCLMFNRKDTLQTRFIQGITRTRLSPPVHYLPSSIEFVEAAVLGLGWAMGPEPMIRELLASGRLKPLIEGHSVDVALYWQHWAVRSVTLARLTAALQQAAQRELRPVTEGQHRKPRRKAGP